MIRNEIDRFRTQYFEQLIEEEKLKEREQLLREQNCFHLYNIEVAPHKDLFIDGYVRFQCSKCERTTLRRTNTFKKRGSAWSACTIL